MLYFHINLAKDPYIRESDGGPSLSTLFGPTKAKGKLKDVIAVSYTHLTLPTKRIV